MKKLLLSVCAFSLTLATLQAGEITKYVNPFIGTGAIDGGLSGNNYPTSPFGMIQLSPDTSEAPNWGDASGYDYNRNTIFGFSHTRLSGTGASDLIDITLMPTSSGRTSSAFTHDEEKARPWPWRFWRQLPAAGQTAVFYDGGYGEAAINIPPAKMRRLYWIWTTRQIRAVGDAGSLTLRSAF